MVSRCISSFAVTNAPSSDSENFQIAMRCLSTCTEITTLIFIFLKISFYVEKRVLSTIIFLHLTGRNYCRVGSRSKYIIWSLLGDWYPISWRLNNSLSFYWLMSFCSFQVAGYAIMRIGNKTWWATKLHHNNGIAFLSNCSYLLSLKKTQLNPLTC